MEFEVEVEHCCCLVVEVEVEDYFLILEVKMYV